MSGSNIFLDEMQDYLEDLCVSNIDIQHVKEGSGQRSFARFQSDEQIAEIQQRSGNNIVIVADYHGNRIGDYDDKKFRQVVKLRFACKANNGNDQTTQINNAVKKAEEIMFDFQTKMQQDFEDDDCGVLRFVEFEKMVWQAFNGPFLDSMYGFDLDIPFKSYMPSFNADKWS